MFGRPGVCYESAQTRKYQLGRTEVIRSASNESKAWAEAMLNPRETVSTPRRVEQSCILTPFHRMHTVLHCSRGPSLDMSNTRPGPPTVRVSTVTCSVSRRCSPLVKKSQGSTPTKPLAKRTIGSYPPLSSRLNSWTVGVTARSFLMVMVSRIPLVMIIFAGLLQA